MSKREEIAPNGDKRYIRRDDRVVEAELGLEDLELPARHLVGLRALDLAEQGDRAVIGLAAAPSLKCGLVWTAGRRYGEQGHRGAELQVVR